MSDPRPAGDAGPPQAGGPEDTSHLGALGPLGADQGRAPGRGGLPPGVVRALPEPSRVTQRTRELLVRGVVGGAITGGAVLGIAYGLLAAAAADILETAGISRGATLFVSVGYGFVAGTVQGAIVGGLTAYYGGGMWTGARVGAAVAGGMFLVQALATGRLILLAGSTVATALIMVLLVGAAVGACVGAAVDALAPPT